ncbi:MAG: hypothetical protein ABL958_01895 [Bdellovibrionia bacterium]
MKSIRQKFTTSGFAFVLISIHLTTVWGAQLERIYHSYIPVAITSGVEITWDKPALVLVDKQFEFTFRGSATAGQTLTFPGGEPKTVGEDGRFEFRLRTYKSEVTAEIQIANAEGGSSKYGIFARTVATKPSPHYKGGLSIVTPGELKELRFDPLNNGIDVTGPRLEYALTESQLRLGNSIFPFDRWIVRPTRKKGIVGVFWPAAMSESQVLHILDEAGTELWEAKVTGLKINTPGILFATSGTPDNVWEGRQKLRICLTRSQGTSSFQLCSLFEPGYKVVQSSESGVFINDQPAAPAAIVEVKEPSKMKFVGGGVTFAVDVDPHAPEILDVTELSQDGRVVVSGRGAAPRDYSAREIEGGWKGFFERNFPLLYFPTAVGVPLRYDLAIAKELPLEIDRISLRETVKNGTYLEKVVLTGVHPFPKVTFSSEDSEVRTNAAREYRWDAAIGGNVGWNSVDLGLEIARGGKSRSHIATYDIYRGDPIELNARVTSMWTPARGELLGLSEFEASYWSEYLFWWKHSLLSLQRWGLRGKFAKSLVGDEGFKVSLGNLDLKYRFNQGLWNHDETVGAIFGYQTVEFNSNPGSFLGAGLFWARSMPDIFDKIFNIVPLFRYPKYVDMEFIYYFAAANPRVKVNPSFVLNFHGKMFFRQDFYLESGFGYRRFDYFNSVVQTELGFVFANLGLGVTY